MKLKVSKKNFKKLLPIVIAAIILLFLPIKSKIEDRIELYQIQKLNDKTIKQIESEDIIERDTASTNLDTLPLEIPEEAYLEVQFICQAPLETSSNWTLHEESCEEAALLMAFLYESNESITKEEANSKILDMIEWQNKNLGGHYDLYADELKSFAIDYLGIKSEQIEITYDAEITDIKKTIAEGHPVIVPITGDILNNPYYPYPGYHMLTVIGYTEDRIITNDNGTRRGADFTYDIETFEAAMKDAGGDIVVLKLDQ